MNKALLANDWLEIMIQLYMGTGKKNRNQI
jgi:hypothetical protein